MHTSSYQNGKDIGLALGRSIQFDNPKDGAVRLTAVQHPLANITDDDTTGPWGDSRHNSHLCGRKGAELVPFGVNTCSSSEKTRTGKHDIGSPPDCLTFSRPEGLDTKLDYKLSSIDGNGRQLDNVETGRVCVLIGPWR